MKAEWLAWRKKPANLILVLFAVLSVPWIRYITIGDDGETISYLQYLTGVLCYCIAVLAGEEFTYDYDREIYKLKQLLHRDCQDVFYRFVVVTVITMLLSIWGFIPLLKQMSPGKLGAVFVGELAVLSIYISVAFIIAKMTKNQIVTLVVVLLGLYANSYVLPQWNPRELYSSFVATVQGGIGNATEKKLFSVALLLQILSCVLVWLSGCLAVKKRRI